MVASNTPQLSRTAEFAWPQGDSPGELAFRAPVDAGLKEAILAKLALHGYIAQELTALAQPNGALGRYRAAGDGGEWFVRVSRRWAEPALEQAITAHLQGGGVTVNHLELAGETFSHEEMSYRFDVRRLIQARHFDGSLSDLTSTAIILEKAHGVLRCFPQAAEVRKHSEQRFERVAQTLVDMKRWLAVRDWARFAAEPAWAKSRADWLGAMLSEFNPHFDRDPDAQTLHAQMHRGNVVFNISDGMPTLLDFEEAVHTFASPAWDWAHFVQRFCMFDSPAPEELTRRLNAIIKGAPCPPGLVKMMQRAAWLSVAILINDFATRGACAPTQEYEKFAQFEEQARLAAAAIDRHFGI